MNEEHAIGYHEVCTEEHVEIKREGKDLNVSCKLQDSGSEYKKVRCFISRMHFRLLCVSLSSTVDKSFPQTEEKKTCS